MLMHLICSMTGSFRQSPLLDGAFDIKAVADDLPEPW